MDLDSPTIQKDIDIKQVGGRKIAKSEIQNAQKCEFRTFLLFTLADHK